MLLTSEFAVRKKLVGVLQLFFQLPDPLLQLLLSLGPLTILLLQTNLQRLVGYAKHITCVTIVQYHCPLPPLGERQSFDRQIYSQTCINVRLQSQIQQC